MPPKKQLAHKHHNVEQRRREEEKEKERKSFHFLYWPRRKNVENEGKQKAKYKLSLFNRRLSTFEAHISDS